MTGSWHHLQNGSDIRGRAEATPEAEANLTPKVMHAIGRAFVIWLSRRLRRSPAEFVVAVGRDSRRSGLDLARAMMAGILAEQARVLDFGLASTPAMFVGTRLSDPLPHAAAILTASHLPADRNGCKFFTAEGGLDAADVAALLEIAGGLAVTSEPDAIENPESSERVTRVDFMARYAAHLAAGIREGCGDNHPNPEQPLRGLHVVVDACNGAGGFFVDRVLRPLGADTVGSRGLEPDGEFLGHAPNPEDPEAMRSLQEVVLDMEADFGILFDPDVDRAAVVDRTGQVLNRNRLLALVAARVLQDHPGSTIVTDSVTSEGLTEFIEQVHGGRHHRFRRGYRYVIREAIRLNASGEACWLAMETSGHAAFRENGFLDDGAFMVARLLVALARARREGRSLADEISGLREAVEMGEFRLRLPDAGFRERGEAILAGCLAAVAAESDWEPVPDSHEGIRVRCTDPKEQGWWLLRLSLHDPVLVLNVEADQPGGLARILGRLLESLQRYPELDLSELSGGSAAP